MRRGFSLSDHTTDLGLLFVVLVWGFSPTLFKIVLQEMQPLAFVFVRFLLLCVVSVGVLAWRGAHGKRAWQIEQRDVVLLIVSGLSGYGVYQLFYMVGLRHTTVFASALLAATVPLWTAAFAVLLKAERFHPLQWVGILVSLAGVGWFLTIGNAHQSELPLDHALSTSDLLLGNGLTLVAAALFALYGIVNKRLAPRYSPPELMCYTLIVGTVALAPFGIPAILSQNWSQVSWHSWVIIPYSVIFPIYATYSIWNWAIGRQGVGYVTLYSYAVPVLGGIVAFLALGEALLPMQIAAGALVLGGMLIARRGAARARPPISATDVQRTKTMPDSDPNSDPTALSATRKM
ncbi:MAG: hypothetical protein OJF49_000107 [Ktedonobacterales bacterium]|nr:MAG: hypothetical protein OJF49_000107 [Ktedonobacterales bacterium]